MKLSEVCLNIVDCPHSTAPDEGSGYALVRTPNIGKGRFNLEGVHRISEAAYKKRCARITPTVNDLILAREAPAGNVAIIKENMEPLALGQRTVLIRPNPEKVCPDFLVYYLLAPQQQNELLGRATGATVAHVNIPIINNLPVSLPPLETQQKIAGILSAYDDLIENNRKQIKLLEEAVQKLYKEWFVKLNFPGHENVKIVDGVPEGWKKEKLINLVDVQYGYAFDGSKFNSEGNGKPIIRIRNIPQGTTDDFTTEQTTDNYIVHNGDIVVGMDGEFHINTWNQNDAYLVQRACSFRPHNENMKGYILQAIYAPIKFFENTVVGATVAHLGKKHIDTIEVLTCNEEFYIPFQNMIRKRQTLLNQIQLLQSARDKLLPKLMNGDFKLDSETSSE